MEFCITVLASTSPRMVIHSPRTPHRSDPWVPRLNLWASAMRPITSEPNTQKESEGEGMVTVSLFNNPTRLRKSPFSQGGNKSSSGQELSHSNTVRPQGIQLHVSAFLTATPPGPDPHGQTLEGVKPENAKDSGDCEQNSALRLRKHSPQSASGLPTS